MDDLAVILKRLYPAMPADPRHHHMPVAVLVAVHNGSSPRTRVALIVPVIPSRRQKVQFSAFFAKPLRVAEAGIRGLIANAVVRTIQIRMTLTPCTIDKQ